MLNLYDCAARCYVFSNNSYSCELYTACIVQNMLQKIYKITNNKLYVKWTTLLASFTTNSTIHHHNPPLISRAALRRLGLTNVRCQIHKRPALFGSQLERCRTTLHVVQLTYTVLIPSLWSYPGDIAACAAPVAPKHTSSSSSNILSYTCYALKLS